MPLAEKHNDCTPCKGEPDGPAKKHFAGWLPGIALMVLPKCPFCFMAFSSTMLLCGEGTTLVSERVHQSGPTIVLSALFCFGAIAGIMLVRRDVRTIVALLLACTGTTFIMTSVWWKGGMTLYYLGTFLIFMGVWVNGSLFSVLEKAGLIKRKRLISRTV